MIKNFTLASFLLFSILTFGQRYSWSESPEPQGVDRQIAPSKYRTLSVDFEELKTALSQAPNEKEVSAADSPFLFELPHPDGGSWMFSVVESSVMAPELQDKYSEIRTFVGQGRGDYAHATLRMDYTPKGFHAQVLMAENSYYIDPYAPGLVDVYICYTRKAFYENNTKTFPKCSVDEHNPIPDRTQSPVEERKHGDGKPGKVGSGSELKTTNGTTLRTYDLALACTGEYAQFHGGTVPDVMAAMVTSMNRVNGVFERDMSLRMIMVPDNDDLIFLDSSTDPYSNGNGGTMLGQNQTTCDNIIGSSNYDIGHVFSTGGGGVAYLGSVCTSNKAGGVTGQNTPVGDPFDIDYVAHEMGHQWGANHTQNNGCNRVSSAAYEPGSASTIMGYAGICPPNLQSNSDDHFHNHSFNEMYDFSVTGFGNSCASPSSTGNTPPSVSLPTGGFYIPVETPFELSAAASDPDGDLLTYCWEQYDLGPSTAGGDDDLTNPSGNAPIFRSWSPTTDDTRVFPRLSDLVNNTTVIGEHLPTYSRDLTFRCTVRDNRAGGGGVTDEEVAFQASDNAGPFLVTAPNAPTTWSGGTTATVTWDVANTNNTPVNCSNVDIFLSLDGGFTYPQTLATNVPNNGSANVTVPQISTTQARVKVKAANNIFFDISNQDFTIAPGFDYDVAILSIDEPTGDVCHSLVEPVITIQNIGSVTLTSVQINYNLNGDPDEIYNWTGTLTSNSSTQVTLPAISAGTGGQTLNVDLLSPNGQSDEDGSNNSGSGVFTVIQLTGESLPVSNDFEGAFPGTDWSIENPDGSLTWIQEGVVNDVNCSSGNAAFIEFFNYNNQGQADDLVTPLIDLTGANAPELTFDYAYARYDNTYFDRMQVQILVGCDENWITLWDKENLDLATAGSVTSEFSPGCGDWSAETIDLSPYTEEIVQIRFRGITGWGNNLYLDNVLVEETAPACSGTPTINNVSPTTYNCSGGQTMVITGSNFCDPVSVTVDGNNASISSSTETQIEAVIPAGSGTADVVVTTSFGNSAAVPVNYAAPVIASVAPTTLPCAGGTTLTVTGSNLCDATQVTVGGNNATNLVQVSSTEIQITAPSGSGLNVPVQVTTLSGTSNTLNVNYAAPVIASVAPTTLPCAGGTTLTITGSDFCSASNVTVGGENAPITSNTATELQVTAPAGSGSNVAVQVTTPSGTSNSLNINYAAPVISSVTPTDIPCAGGTSVTVTGTNFCDVVDVTIGGASAVDFTEVSSTELEVLLGGGFGTQALVVVTPSGNSNGVNITYTQAGCTDPNACNYDPAALCDDGSCVGAPCDPVCEIELTASATPADPGFANGTATVIATGGEQPYSYQWDDSFFQTTATAVGLFPGTYTCTVTDAENCSEEISVEVTLFTGVPLTKVSSPYCNTSGYALGDFISCNAVQNADAYRWELVVQGGNALPEYTRFNNKYLRIQWVTGTQPGVTYEVRVKARVAGEWGDYGPICTIATSPNIPTTELRPEYHPTNNSGQLYSMCDFAIAYGVANATNYRWRFDPDTDPNNGNEIIYTRGTGNPATRLSWVNGLAPGNTYDIAVAVEIGGTWGDYGVVHSIDLDDTSKPVIRPAFCNQTISPNGYVLASSVCAADYYQYLFEPVGGGQASTRTSGNYVCFLSGVSPELTPGDYNVSSRVSQGGVLGDYGASCVITIAGSQNSFGDAGFKTAQTTTNAIVFPNPGDGSDVNIEMELKTNGTHEVIVKLINAYGQQIGVDQFEVEGRQIYRKLQYNQQLVSGLYFVEIIADNKREALVKMVVQ